MLKIRSSVLASSSYLEMHLCIVAMANAIKMLPTSSYFPRDASKGEKEFNCDPQTERGEDEASFGTWRPPRKVTAGPLVVVVVRGASSACLSCTFKKSKKQLRTESNEENYPWVWGRKSFCPLSLAVANHKY